jgi:hypothetical protein
MDGTMGRSRSARISPGGGDMGKSTDPWQPVDQSPIKVDISGLQDFVKLLNDELKNDFTVNMNQGVKPMLQVVPGLGRLNESAFFQQAHALARVAIIGLLRDVPIGLEALSSAATSIYYEYAGGDNLSAAQVDDVNNAFSPPPGTMTLRQKFKLDDDGTSQDPGQDQDPGQPATPPPASGQDDGSSKPFNPDDPQVVAPNQPGQYVIPGDSDHMNDTPADPLWPPSGKS